jgi:hypothetical protein
MATHFIRLAALTAVVGALMVPSARAAQVRVGVQIGAPPPVVVAPPPVYGGQVYGGPVYGGPVYGGRVVAPRGYVWQPGYFVRTMFGRRWVPGAWVRERVPYGNAYGYWRNRGRDRDDRWRR